MRASMANAETAETTSSSQRSIGISAAYALVGLFVGGASLVRFIAAAFDVGLAETLADVLGFYESAVDAIVSPINDLLPIHSWMSEAVVFLARMNISFSTDYVGILREMQPISLVCAGIGLRVDATRLSSFPQWLAYATFWAIMGVAGFAALYLMMPIAWFIGSRFSSSSVRALGGNVDDHRRELAFARDFSILLGLSGVAAIVFFGVNEALL